MVMMKNSGKIVVFGAIVIALFLIMSVNWHSGVDSDVHKNREVYAVDSTCIVRNAYDNPVSLHAGEKVKIIEHF